MINTKKQSFFTIFIVIGAALLLYDLAFESEEVYFKIGGLVILMFGLYSSTRQWANDNDKNKTDTNKSEDKTNNVEAENIEQSKQNQS